MAEYRMLRDEIASATNRRFEIWKYGIPVVGLLLAYGAKSISEPADGWSGYYIIGALTPALIWLLISLWTGEYLRSQRAGYYCRRLEQKINTWHPDSLGWETFLSPTKGKAKHETYDAELRFAQCICYVLYVIGLSFLFKRPSFLLIDWLIAILAVFVIAFAHVELSRRVRRTMADAWRYNSALEPE